MTVAVTLPPAVTEFEDRVKVEFVALGVARPLTTSDCVAVIEVAVTVAVMVLVIATCGVMVHVTTPEPFVVVPHELGKVPVSAPPV